VIKDTAGCTAEGRFESGVVPCKLPCEGEAIRAGYRFWIPEAPPGLPINDYKAVVSRFAIREPDGNLIELSPAEVTGLIQHPSPIRTADYGGVVQRWLDAINKLVANKVGSDRWFTLEYEPAPAAAMTGTLFVDRLTCLDFTFELVVTFSQEKKRRRLKLTYNAGGTVVQESDTEPVVIPPFRGSTSNKCRPTERPVLLCERTDLTLQIERDGVITETGTGTVTLTAVLSGQDQEATLLWEIQDGIPSIAGGKQVVLKFDPIKPAEKLVLLTAITDTGCTVTLDQTINIAKLEG